MANEGFKRKLAAILSADVVGYSRLMRDDEAATVHDLAAHRVLITKIIQQHHGRVVDSPGDNILAEFASVVDSVNGAIMIQEEIKRRNTDTPEDRRMEFRIGINLGDVIEEEERIYGDGVNIAARVEGFATAGGISISGTVYEHIKDKVSLGYHYLGEQDVKNIPEPVRVYQILTEREDAGKMIEAKKPKTSKRRYAAFGALGLIILVACVLVIWNNYFRVQIEPASLDKMAFPLPDMPSIAVLPFNNMSGDPEQEYLGDGLTEEIISALSKVPRLFVIARNSTFTYKGKPVKVQQVSEKLGVRYVLEGSVRKAGDRVRVTAQLIDATTGHHLWSERYDRELKDIFALQDEITMKIITAMQVKLTEGEQARLWGKGTDNLDAYLKFLQGSKHFRRLNPDDDILARQYFKEAIALDPEFATPYSWLGHIHLNEVKGGLSKSPQKSIGQAFKLAQKALALDESHHSVHLLLGAIHNIIRQDEKAIAALERAVALAPNSTDSLSFLGLALSSAGRPQEAIPHLKRAIRLNPLDPTVGLFGLGVAYIRMERYEEAITVLKKSLHYQPDFLGAHVRLSGCYAALGREEEAHAEAAEVLRLNPKLSVKKFAKTSPVRDKAERERIIDALRKAGLPE